MAKPKIMQDIDNLKQLDTNGDGKVNSAVTADTADNAVNADKIDGKHYFVQDGQPAASSVGDKWFAPTSGVYSIWNGSVWIGMNTYAP